MRASLVDDQAPLAARYRALFSLRNLAGDKAEQALIEGEKNDESKFESATARGLTTMLTVFLSTSSSTTSSSKPQKNQK